VRCGEREMEKSCGPVISSGAAHDKRWRWQQRY
jgi:hypothetical protein